MMNKDLIDFTKKILSRYNATPDEWDAFEAVKWSINTTHKISAVFYPQKNEVEATWENIATGKTVCATFPVTPDQGENIAEVLMRWPPKWTDLKPLATDSFQHWRQEQLGT